MRRSVIIMLSLFLLLVFTSAGDIVEWIPDEFHISVFHADGDQHADNDNCENGLGEDIQTHTAELVIDGSRDFSIRRTTRGFSILPMRHGEMITPPPEQA